MKTPELDTPIAILRDISSGIENGPGLILNDGFKMHLRIKAVLKSYAAGEYFFDEGTEKYTEGWVPPGEPIER